MRAISVVPLSSVATDALFLQSLVLKILVEMCARQDENGRENPDYRMRRNAFMDANIGKSILDFIDQENKDQIGRTESLEYSLVLIRNFSCTGKLISSFLIDIYVLLHQALTLKSNQDLMLQ
jgi:hypothetical protein